MGFEYWVGWALGIAGLLIGGLLLHLAKRFVNKTFERWARKDLEDLQLKLTVKSMAYAFKKQENGAGKLFRKNFKEKLNELEKEHRIEITDDDEIEDD